MSYYCYIIYSKSLDAYYIGSTSDIKSRIEDHNNSRGSKFTKRAKDWFYVYQELFKSRSGAQKREYEIKRKKSRKYIEWLVQNK